MPLARIRKFEEEVRELHLSFECLLCGTAELGRIKLKVTDTDTCRVQDDFCGDELSELLRTAGDLVVHAYLLPSKQSLLMFVGGGEPNHFYDIDLVAATTGGRVKESHFSVEILDNRVC